MDARYPTFQVIGEENGDAPDWLADPLERGAFAKIQIRNHTSCDFAGLRSQGLGGPMVSQREFGQILREQAEKRWPKEPNEPECGFYFEHD